MGLFRVDWVEHALSAAPYRPLFSKWPLLTEWEKAECRLVLLVQRGQAAWLTQPHVVSTQLTCHTAMFHHQRTDMAPLTATKVQFVAFGL